MKTERGIQGHRTQVFLFDNSADLKSEKHDTCPVFPSPMKAEQEVLTSKANTSPNNPVIYDDAVRLYHINSYAQHAT